MSSELLIPQYREATRLHRLIDNFCAILDTFIEQPLNRMARPINPDVSTGVLLDWIGLRLGLFRPRVRSQDFDWLGFEGSEEHGFDQAPFFSLQADIEGSVPINDGNYARLLKARALFLRSRADRTSIERILNVIFDQGYIIDGSEICSPPDPPSIQFIGHTSNNIIVFWSVPNSNGAPILQYEVEVVRNGVVESLRVTDGQSLNYGNIEPGDYFSFQVYATSALGRSAGGNVEQLTLPPASGEDPPMPTRFVRFDGPTVVPEGQPGEGNLDISAHIAFGAGVTSVQFSDVTIDPRHEISSVGVESGVSTDPAADFVFRRQIVPPEPVRETRIYSVTFQVEDDLGSIARESVLFTVNGDPNIVSDVKCMLLNAPTRDVQVVREYMDALIPRPVGTGMVIENVET